MRNIWTIARREYAVYFSSFTAYLFAAIFLFVVGYFFFLSVQDSLINFSAPPGTEIVIGPLMFLLVIATPAFTMRLLSEELRLGTLELLMTAPVRDAELVVGKWLGSLLFVGTLLAFTLIYPLFLHQVIDPGIDQGPLISGYLGVLLVAASFLAIGVAVSALFANQIASFIAAFGANLILWWMTSAMSQGADPGLVQDILRHMDMQAHFYESFYSGVIPLSGVVYLVSLTAFSLVLGTVFTEMRRWR